MEMVEGRRLRDRINMREEVIKKVCELSMTAPHNSNYGDHQEHYLYHECPNPSLEVMFVFARSWSVGDWFNGLSPFGETTINLALFPCLRTIGADDIALVNAAFARRFEMILETTLLAIQVEKALKVGKQVVFAGHSTGGSTAIFATLWFLNKYTRHGKISPRCVTFGSPLVGDWIFPHALRRENWARYFIHFLTRYDIMPLVTLSPFSSIFSELPRVLHFFNPESTQDNSILTTEFSTFIITVMVNASMVASHAASKLMGGPSVLVESFSSFIELSPYRPFGTYILCNAMDKIIVVEDSNAVLQMLLYFSKLNNEAEGAGIAYTRLNEHMVYETATKGLKGAISLDHHENTNWSIAGLGLSRRAKLCLRSAEEAEKLKWKNQETIKKEGIKEGLKKIKEYQIDCEKHRLGYYDSFKLQKEEKDFKANVTRLVLTGLWDVVMEKFKKYELPDEFEGQKEWIDLGTQHRRLVEPLDIANYYRHGKNEDSGTYLKKGRPRLYRYTQRWLEHHERRPHEPLSESSFMALVEDIRITSKSKSFEDIKETLISLERQILQWDRAKILGLDLFMEKSTFSQWWNSLPDQHRSESCIRHFFFKIKANPT